MKLDLRDWTIYMGWDDHNISANFYLRPLVLGWTLEYLIWDLPPLNHAHVTFIHGTRDQGPLVMIWTSGHGTFSRRTPDLGPWSMGPESLGISWTF